MSTGECPSSECEQVLRAGGLALVIWALLHPRSVRDLQDYVRSKWPTLTEGDLAHMLALGQSAIRAGRLANQLPPDRVLPLDEIPVNPYLFADQPLGRRFLYTVGIHFTDPVSGRGRMLTLHEPAAVLQSPDQIFDLVQQQTPQLSDKYERFNAWLQQHVLTNVDVTILGVERLY